ncbi:MAG TPA: hypothetical protein VL405_00140 [Sphingomonas sp.]|jgi:hypothetical protein|nr:hypothetical protein [Sphingomonas sp.]
MKAAANGLTGMIVAVLAGMLLAVLAQHGFVSAEMTRLAGQAILMRDGQSALGDGLIAYPVLPAALMHLTANPVFPDLPLPGLAAAAIAGLIAFLWCQALANRRFPLWIAVVCTLLLCANPLFLRALAAGPGRLLLILAFWMMGEGLHRFRAEGSAPDAALVGIGLMLMVWAHPAGLILAFAALPFLALAAPMDMLEKGATGLFLLLLFPLLFTMLSLGYLNWLFIGDAWSTIGAASAAFGAPGTGPPLSFPTIALILTLYALVSTPVAVFLAVRSRRRSLIMLPLLSLVGTAIIGASFALLFGVAYGVADALSPAIAVAVIALARWPQPEDKLPVAVFGLLLLGFVGGVGATVGDGSPEGQRLLAAAGNGKANAAFAAEANLGAYLRGKQSVLIDADAATATVAARGNAVGLITDADPRFSLALLSNVPRAHYIVARDIDETGGTDRLVRRFPRLYADGADGFDLVYDHDGWRVYQQEGQKL